MLKLEQKLKKQMEKMSNKTIRQMQNHCLLLTLLVIILLWKMIVTTQNNPFVLDIQPVIIAVVLAFFCVAIFFAAKVVSISTAILLERIKK